MSTHGPSRTSRHARSQAAIRGIADIMARPGSWHHERRAFAPIENYGHRMSVARLYSQVPNAHRGTIGRTVQERPEFVIERFSCSSGGHETKMSLSTVTGPLFGPP